MASSKVQRTTLPGRLPDLISFSSSLNGLSTPLWVEITNTLPPQIKSAIAALSSASASSWKANSSRIT